MVSVSVTVGVLVTSTVLSASCVVTVIVVLGGSVVVVESVDKRLCVDAVATTTVELVSVFETITGGGVDMTQGPQPCFVMVIVLVVDVKIVVVCGWTNASQASEITWHAKPSTAAGTPRTVQASAAQGSGLRLNTDVVVSLQKPRVSVPLSRNG